MCACVYVSRFFCVFLWGFLFIQTCTQIFLLSWFFFNVWIWKENLLINWKEENCVSLKLLKALKLLKTWHDFAIIVKDKNSFKWAVQNPWLSRSELNVHQQQLKFGKDYINCPSGCLSAMLMHFINLLSFLLLIYRRYFYALGS